MGLSERIRSSLARKADSIALTCGSQMLCWRDVSLLAEKIGCLHPGPARVGLVAHNRAWEAATLVASLASAKTTVMIHPLQSGTAMVADLARLDLDMLVADHTAWSEELVATCRESGLLGLALTGGQESPLRVVAPARRDCEPARRRDAGIAVETLTSGTTGVSKRVAIPFAGLEQTVDDIIRLSTQAGEEPGSQAPLIEYMPLFAIGGVYYSAMAGVCGRRFFIQEKFVPEVFGDAVRRYRPKMVGLNPTLMRMVIDADIPPADFSSLVAVRSGNAFLDPKTRAAWQARYGIPILHVYGATEFYGPVTGWTLALYEAHRASNRVEESAGLPRPGMTLRVASDDGIVPAGEIGLLHVKADRVGPDWIVTNDLASLDADGFLYLHGRADDAINRGGYKVLPATIEDALRQHPTVSDVAVTAIKDERLGEVPVAAVELRAGAQASAEELRAFARQHLVAYQVPAEIRIVAQIPRTALLKVSREGLRALFGGTAP